MSGVRRHTWAGLLAIVFLLPIVAALQDAAVPWSLKTALVMVAGSAALYPLAGMFVLIGLVTTAMPVTAYVGGLGGAAFTECLVLAFAGGSGLGSALRPADHLDRLSRAALVLGAAVLTSGIVDLAAMRAVAPRQPFFSDLWTHLVARYWTEDASGWRVLHLSLYWLALLAAAVSIERTARSSASGRAAAVWWWAGGLAAALSMTVLRVVDVIARSEEPWLTALVGVLRYVRLSVLHPDPNAAGSILAFALVTALIAGWRRRLWWMLGLVAPLLAVGFIFAQSRASIGAVLVVMFAVAIRARTWTRQSATAALGAACVVVLVAATWMASSRSHGAFTDALAIRLQMTEVGLEMAERFPAWGVGLGDYQRTSRRFITPEMPQLSAFTWGGGENAHNNYLQVAVELGIPAGLAFLWLVIPAAVVSWRRSASQSAEAAGLGAGLTAFLLSACFGHPLLVSEVAAFFFIALGLAAASHEASPRTRALEQPVMIVALVLYLGSLTWRL